MQTYHNNIGKKAI